MSSSVIFACTSSESKKKIRPSTRGQETYLEWKGTLSRGSKRTLQILFHSIVIASERLFSGSSLSPTTMRRSCTMYDSMLKGCLLLFSSLPSDVFLFSVSRFLFLSLSHSLTHSRTPRAPLSFSLPLSLTHTGTRTGLLSLSLTLSLSQSIPLCAFVCLRAFE